MPPPRIVVIGSCNVDLTAFTERIPRAGETVFGTRFDLGFGGKGANQAAAASLCGARVAMVAKVGRDLFGPSTIDNLQRRGVDTTHVDVVEGASSGVAPILVEPSGQNRIVVVSGANDLVGREDVDAALPMLREADCLLLQLEIPLATVDYAIRVAKRLGIRCVLNPAPALAIDPSILSLVDYLIPNEREAEALEGLPIGTLDDARASAARLLARGSSRVIITLGARGALLADETAAHHIAPFAVEAVDTTGAGDAFVGSFVTFLCEGMTAREAATRANLYAALSTTQVGTQKSFPSRDVFDAEWRRRHATRTQAPSSPEPRGEGPA